MEEFSDNNFRHLRKGDKIMNYTEIIEKIDTLNRKLDDIWEHL